MRKVGTHDFPAIDRVVYGEAASEALKDEAVRLDPKRVFLIVSRTLNTKTDEIEKIRRTLGVKHVATFDGIAQHTTRKQAAEVPRFSRRYSSPTHFQPGRGAASLRGIAVQALHEIRWSSTVGFLAAAHRRQFRQSGVCDSRKCRLWLNGSFSSFPMIGHQAAAASSASLSINVLDCWAFLVLGSSTVPSRAKARRSEIFVAACLTGSDARWAYLAVV